MMSNRLSLFMSKRLLRFFLFVSVAFLLLFFLYFPDSETNSKTILSAPDYLSNDPDHLASFLKSPRLKEIHEENLEHLAQVEKLKQLKYQQELEQQHQMMEHEKYLQEQRKIHKDPIKEEEQNQEILRDLVNLQFSSNKDKKKNTNRQDSKNVNINSEKDDNKEDMDAMRELTPFTSIGKYNTDPKFNDTMEYIRQYSGKPGAKPRATFLTLLRNEDADDMVRTIMNFQRKFNDKFEYPWIFLNDEEFDTSVKEVLQKTAPSIKMIFGTIPKEHWSYPHWIDQDKAAQGRQKLTEMDVIYGDSESYRHMCRYQSGFFWRHELLDDYDWYWRVEPETNLHCEVSYDVFQWMQDNDKMYGFTLSIHEFEATVSSLWTSVKKFFRANPSYKNEYNLKKFISNDGGVTYNLCHFWSNFEVANLHLWRSPAYRHFFDFLDREGGFFYERWGDAPIHSIAASMFLPKEKIHHFKDIGYHHPPYNSCPIEDKIYKSNKCDCDQDKDFTFHDYACGQEFYAAQGIEKPINWRRNVGKW
ncbi:hypothetical protein TBLA_0A00470 [Henningerozyma blattae CBS 6284]|uniref:Glycosyltransferase family 15 protein n=1 Tax=Henningerozyma blattae (strain ATCC 34711 / CBS 6284 / DSM 70876 / NBRC 10599 / NRRL Y-10934 / UCD 77-7) TaxID=1071380 RepID=I2GUP5_HENB6|nr:hypothetical protein TBLA_0A00470 [Tetrapisispora blattae CBS 6284]CCH57847.1 hypothetical protein TBLA_0A00470 [Tetrapisispora blattae CBS 6284]